MQVHLNIRCLLCINIHPNAWILLKFHSTYGETIKKDHLYTPYSPDEI